VLLLAYLMIFDFNFIILYLTDPNLLIDGRATGFDLRNSLIHDYSPHSSWWFQSIHLLLSLSSISHYLNALHKPEILNWCFLGFWLFHWCCVWFGLSHFNSLVKFYDQFHNSSELSFSMKFKAWRASGSTQKSIDH